MAIKGLTERRRMPRLGKIHLGVKAVNPQGKEYPKAVDYLVCPPEVQKVFGEKPKELRILIPVEDEEKWASQYYRLYSRTRGLICKGDGEKAMRLVDSKTGDLTWKDDAKEVVMKEVVCKGRECGDYNVRCKEVMNLQFLLPEVPGLGVWQIDTGSINSILNINAGADFIRRLYGRISLLPLLLTVEPQTVKTPDGKQKTVWVLNLRTREKLGDLMQLAQLKPAELLALPETGDIELPISDDETPELIIPENQEPKAKNTQVETFDAIPSVKPEKQASKAAGGQTVDLSKLEFANPLELFAAANKHFNLSKVQVQKEAAMYDLSNTAQRQKAWLAIVSVYQTKEG